MVFYRFCRYVCLIFFRLYFNISVEGLPNLYSLKKGGVLIANHKSYLDPIFMGLFIKNRRLFFMAKKELFNIPMLKTIIKKLGAFPVDRGRHDVLALRNAIDLIKSGELVAMFPQGCRCKKIEDKEPKTGFVKISIASGGYVVPCALKYFGYMFRSRVKVVFGKPISFTKNEEIDFLEMKAIRKSCWDEVLRLYHEI